MKIYSFIEYLNAGGKLPPAFNLIPKISIPDYDDEFASIVNTEYDFGALFLSRFWNRKFAVEQIDGRDDFEIFYWLYLDKKAMIKIPEYVKKFAKYNDLDNVFDVERVETTENEAKTENFVGAFGSGTEIDVPANKTAETKGGGGETKTYKGASESERISSIERLLEIKNLYDKLLDEFEPLFLGVF